MKKIVYITPHLSTGGLPQYLLKQIESFSKDNEIYCVEWDDITGGVLVVQRNKIKKLLGNNLITLSNDKSFINSIIESIKPDIIHFQEIPESFIDETILKGIYSESRNYFIVITTHSSYTDPATIKYTADKFVLVSKWSHNKFKDFYKESIPCDIWEYSIDKISYSKEEAKKLLGFDLEYKHVLHVGLFTPGKNQKHIVDVAKRCLDYKIKFHFVGNQAMNFENYWSPIMKELPSNCVWHGERMDVEEFYKAADLFYFPSKFELSPIAIKEALSYNLPLFLTKLETYESDYDEYATYITEDVNDAVNKLLNHFSIDKKNNKNKVKFLHILTDIDTDREVKSMQSLTKMQNFGHEYLPIVSRRYTDIPPSDTCQYPEKISMEPGNKLTPAHYGCYLGHKKAFEIGMKSNSEYIMICECDAVIDVSNEEFDKKIQFAIQKINDDNLLMFSFGYHNNTDILEKKLDYWIVNRFYGAHAYLIPKKSFEIIKKVYDTKKWNVADLFFADNLSEYRIGIFQTPPTKQTEGYSILDKIYNNDRY